MRNPSSGWNALKWNYLGNCVRGLSGFAIGALLAHLLGPKPFGIIGIALLVLGFGNLVVDCGLGAVAIHKEQLEDDKIRFLFTCQSLLGLLFTIAGWLLAGPICNLLRAPEATDSVRAMSTIFVLQGMGQTAASLMRRHLRFAELQRISIFSYLFSFLLCGTVLALLGYGVWSLVVAQILQAALSSIFYFWRSPHDIRLLWKNCYFRLMVYSVKVLSSNLISWSVVNLDNAGASRFFGVTQLGYYSRAFNLGRTTADSSVSALQGVLFPIFSRNQKSPATLKSLYIAALRAVLLLQLPFFLFCAFLSPDIIQVVYGTKWAPAAPLFRALALCMPVNSALALSGPLLWGIGKVGEDVRAQIGAFVAMIIALALSSRLSILALAWLMLPVYFIRFLLLLVPVCRSLSISFGELALMVSQMISMALASAAPAWAVDWYLSSLNINPFLRVAAAAALAAAIWVSGVRLFPRTLLGRFLESYLAKKQAVRWFLPSLREHAEAAGL